MTDKPKPSMRVQRAASKYLSVFYSANETVAPSDAAACLERHGYVWDGSEWRHDPEEAKARGQRVDYGRKP